MKHAIRLINFHVLVLGGIVSVIFIGLISAITFIPGHPNLVSCLVDGVVLQLVMLEPGIVVRVIDLRRTRRPTVAYFVVNTLVAVSFGVACGWLLFKMLPKSISA